MKSWYSRCYFQLPSFERGGGGGRLEKTISCKVFTVKKNHATRMAIKNASTALIKLPAPLASEKKNSCTNQFFHSPPQRSNGPPLTLWFSCGKFWGVYKTKTEDRRPKTEDRRSKTEDRKTKSSLILGLSNSRQL